MAYRLVLFDGLSVPPHITAGNSQDMGTGSALTSFLPLPGGGFYDNYRSLKSPQGIRPLSKSGIFWGTDDELEAEINAWRAKIGKRGRLTVEWDNGALRWQWARLQDVSAPRPRDAKGGWLPFTFTWITAAQNWRGFAYQEPEWTWGDESWVFGDGSTGMGVGPVTFTLADADETVTVNQGGDIDAPNVILRFETTGTWENIAIVNEATGQRIDLDYPAASTIRMYEINAGARSVYAGGAEKNISAASRTGNTVTVTTSSAHGLVTGDTVRIADTDLYDGDYYPVTVTSTTVFTVELSPRVRAYGPIGAGTVRELTSMFNETTFSDKANWFFLAPGDNDLHIEWGTFPSSASLTVEYVDHYA